MSRRLQITLGTNETARRKAALKRLAAVTGSIGRNNEPSISEMVIRLAEAAEYDLQRTAVAWQEIAQTWREAKVAELEQERLEAVENE